MSGIQYAPWYSPVFSLRWRLSFVYSALFVVFVSILSVLLYNFTSEQLLHNAQATFQQHALALRTRLIQEACYRTSGQTLDAFIQQNDEGDIASISIIDNTGKVLASTDQGQINHPLSYINQTQMARADTSPQQALTLSNGPSNDGLLLSVRNAISCQSLTPAPAYIAILASYTSVQSTVNTLFLLLGVTTLIMVVVGILVISFATAFMLRPLGVVTGATKEFALGDLQRRVPIPQSNDEIGALAASFNQMADRIEQMFAAQQASERRARRFVSDASHELRTPITSLRGFTEVLLRGAKDDPATTQHVLTLMKVEAIRMTKLVNDLLALARLDEGHFADPEIIDLVDLAIESLQQVRKEAPADCKLALELATQERLKIYAGSESIKQMLAILLDNSTKYGCTGEKKRILLQLDKHASHVLIQIIDYGVGITQDDLPYVFDRFYRGINAHVSTNTPIPGTGLGLPIAQAIAQAYHGIITACSDPGKETIFTVAFPSAS